MTDDVLTVVDWERWQSYRSDRGQPPWVKVYRRLQRNPKWVSLTDAQRGQLISVWLLAADHDGTIEAPAGTLASFVERVGALSEPLDLEALTAAGFLLWSQGDAKVTPTRRQGDAKVTPQKQSTETDVEAEEEDPPHTPPRGGGTDRWTRYWTSRPSKRTGAPPPDPPDFASFWEAYPKKIGKGDARKAWAKANLPALDVVLNAVRAQADSEQWRRDGGNFVPMPATWLNQTRWEDEPGPVRTVPERERQRDEEGDAWVQRKQAEREAFAKAANAKALR